MLDKNIGQKLAKELQIDLFTIYREYLQLLFLKYFYNQKGSEKVYFKGGTALHFLFGSFRFSEDLDFTTLIPEEQIKILVEKTLKNLNRETAKISFKKIKTLPNSYSGKLIENVPEFKFPLTIKLDFSLREKSYYPDNNYIETIFPISPYPHVAHLKIEELMAEKIRAFIIRQKGRDLFDLWFLLSKRIIINWDLVNKKMALYKKEITKAQLLQAIKNFSEREIKIDLTKFLPVSQRALTGKIKSLMQERLNIANF